MPAPKETLIRYMDDNVKPKKGEEVLHPAYHASPDEKMILPNQWADILLGVEVAIPPTDTVYFMSFIDGLLVPVPLYTGYQKEMTVRTLNMMNTYITLKPYQRVGSLLRLQLKKW